MLICLACASNLFTQQHITCTVLSTTRPLAAMWYASYASPQCTIVHHHHHHQHLLVICLCLSPPPFPSAPKLLFSHVCVCHPCKCLIRIHALLPAMSSPQSLSVSVDLSKVTYSPPDGVKRAVIGLAPVPTFDLLIDSCPWTISLPPPCQPPSLLKL